jgi:hypothetical protein
MELLHLSYIRLKSLHIYRKHVHRDDHLVQVAPRCFYLLLD